MSTQNEVLDRLSTLERELRWWRRLGVAAAATAIVTTGVAANGTPEVPDLIQAKEFRLIGDDGKVVAYLETGSTTRLRMHDQPGASSLVLGVGGNNAGLYLEDSDRKNIAEIEASANGGSIVLRKIGDDHGHIVAKSGTKGTFVDLESSVGTSRLEP